MLRARARFAREVRAVVERGRVDLPGAEQALAALRASAPARALPEAWRDADLSLIGEYHHDRDQPLAPVSIFDRKFLLGARLELNDAHLSSVFLGYTAQASDLRNNMLSASLDLGLSDAVRAGVSAALINSSASDVVWDALASDSHVALELSYSF